MKTRLLLILLCLTPALMLGQWATRSSQKTQVDTLLPTNGAGAITAAHLRTLTKLMIDSSYNPLDDGTPAASSHSHPATGISDSTVTGRNLVKLADPGAVVYMRINADNTISLLDAASFRAAIGAGTSSFNGSAASLTGLLPPARIGSGSPLMVVRLNAAGDALEFATVSVGGGDMLASNNLSELTNKPTAFAAIKQPATTTATGVVELATDGENAAGVVVQGNDARLGDNRTPSDGSVTTAKIQAATLVTAAEAIAGNNNDTTLPTSAAVSGAITAERSATATLSSKRVSPRVTSITSAAAPAINTDTTDAVTITALAVNITSMTSNLTGTPVNFDKLVIRIKDDGTPRTIAWGASFVSRTAALPVTTVSGKITGTVFWWNAATNTWDCMASGTEI